MATINIIKDIENNAYFKSTPVISNLLDYFSDYATKKSHLLRLAIGGSVAWASSTGFLLIL